MAIKVISLDTLKDGSIDETIQSAFREVIADIKDENKDAQKRRKVVVTFLIDPTPDRAGAKMTTEVKTTLAGQNKSGAMLFFEKKGGQIIAHDEDPAQGKLLK